MNEHQVEELEKMFPKGFILIALVDIGKKDKGEQGADGFSLYMANPLMRESISAIVDDLSEQLGDPDWYVQPDEGEEDEKEDDEEDDEEE